MESPKKRMTRQRRLILEELQGVTSHPTALELYEMVKSKIPHISLGTIYRNLDILNESGQILKLEQAGKQTRFDGNAKRHFHLRCTSCGRVFDIDPEAGGDFLSDSALNIISARTGFQVTNYKLNFLGYCTSCKPR